MEDKVPENRSETGRDDRGRFRPGVTGNAGGRPVSLASAILARRPTTSDDLVEFWRLVAFGSASAVEKRYGMKPRLQDRLAAAAELANRLHGRPVPTVETETPAPSGPVFLFPPGTHIAVE